MENISEIQITINNIFDIRPYSQELENEIENTLKRKLKVNDKFQLGQVMPLFFPSEIANILYQKGYVLEAKLIRDFFVTSEGHDICGMLDTSLGNWGTDRIIKHIFRHKTIDIDFNK